MAKKKLTKQAKAEATARKSAAMIASWNRRKKAREKVDVVKNARNIPVDPDRASVAEWIQETPKQQIERYLIENKMQSERIQRLEHKLMQVQTLNGALMNIVRSIQDLDRMAP